MHAIIKDTEGNIIGLWEDAERMFNAKKKVS